AAIGVGGGTEDAALQRCLTADVRHPPRRPEDLHGPSGCAAAVGSGVGVLAGIVRLSVDPQLEFFADLEEGNALGGDGHDAPGLGIATLARLPVLDDETAEAADLDALTLGEGIGHALEDGLHHDFGVVPRETWIQAD